MPLKDLARQLPLKRHYSTLNRWVNKGIRCNGKVIKLESVMLGRWHYSSVEAVERFIAAQNPVDT